MKKLCPYWQPTAQRKAVIKSASAVHFAINAAQCFALFIFSLVIFIPYMSVAAQTDIPENLVITLGQFDASNYPEITMYVNITDQDGNNVGGLAQSDFQVTEDGETVEVVEFAGIGEERLVDIIYVFDTTGSMREEIDGVIHTSIAFADELESKGRDYRLGLVTFGDTILGVYHPDDKLTDNAQQFKDWVSVLSAKGGDGDPENSYGAIKRALQMQFRTQSQKILILITDAPAHVYGDEPDGGYEFEDHDLELGKIRTLLNEHNVSVYAITPAFSDFTSLADSTGGRFYDLDNNPDFTSIIEEIGKTIASQYRITYRSPRPTYDGTRRNVQIKIGHSDISTEYHEQHLLTVQSDLLVGTLCLLPLLAALSIPTMLAYFGRQLKPPAGVQSSGSAISSTPRAVSGAYQDAYLQDAAPPNVADSMGTNSTMSPSATQCRICGYAMSSTARFCPRCGQPAQSGSLGNAVMPTLLAQSPQSTPTVPETCPACGRQVRPGAKFCNACGHKFTSG